MVVNTVDGQIISLTISAGVCDIAPNGSFDEAINHADEMLYVAKRKGLDRVKLFMRPS